MLGRQVRLKTEALPARTEPGRRPSPSAGAGRPAIGRWAVRGRPGCQMESLVSAEHTFWGQVLTQPFAKCTSLHKPPHHSAPPQ